MNELPDKLIHTACIYLNTGQLGQLQRVSNRFHIIAADPFLMLDAYGRLVRCELMQSAQSQEIIDSFVKSTIKQQQHNWERAHSLRPLRRHREAISPAKNLYRVIQKYKRGIYEYWIHRPLYSAYAYKGYFPPKILVAEYVRKHVRGGQRYQTGPSTQTILKYATHRADANAATCMPSAPKPTWIPYEYSPIG